MRGPTDDTPVDGERSRRIAEIVGSALERPAAERSAYLAAACGSDAGLLREAEALLDADRTEEGFTAPPHRAQNLIGSLLDHYRILDRLGAGGMGEVYLAEDTKLGRQVALKLLPRELAGSPERLARFQREARTVAALNHPNIVTLYSIEDAHGLHFLTMERVEGVILQKKIVPGGLPLNELLRLALPLADAVAAAHAQGIAHRDLKPANVMIADDGRLKVLDFGIAKPTADSRQHAASASITQDGRVLGTVAYMAPEQVAGHPADRRSDVFSLGIVLSELATGTHPFTAPAARLPSRLRPILQRCLDKDPDRRFQDARELADALRDLQRELDTGRFPALYALSHRGLAVAAGLLVLAGIILWIGRVPREVPAPAAPSSPLPARKTIAVPPGPKLQQMDTSSIEARRLYIEALRLHDEGKTSEAAALLEKAVEIDPGFALALADLGALHRNLGHRELSRKYLARAVEHAERLPADERWVVQGRFYAETWSTYGKAIASFQEHLRRAPDSQPPRNNLAALETYLERYDSALRNYEQLLAQGTSFASTTVSAANAYAALGRFEPGRQRLLALIAREPDSWVAHAGLAWLLIIQGQLDEAEAALDRADALRPGNDVVLQARWRLAVLRKDWAGAERAARELEGLGDPYTRWRGALSRARNAQLRGDSATALTHLDEAAHAFPRPEGYTAMAHCWKADLLLDLGEPARALKEARRAQEIAPGDWPELQGMFLAALAQQDLGRPAEADALLAELKRRAAVTPNAVEQRQVLRLEGRLALARGNPEAAAVALRRAASLLPPRGVEIHQYVQPDHVPVWVDLGRAELAAGRPELARRWLEQAAASGAEHIEFPVAYTRGAELLKRLLASTP
jgi:serine/threonine protein kinase